MNVMISERMIELLKRQISHELENMYIYQKIAMWLDVKGFTYLSEYYKDWSLEEKKHSIYVQEFLEGINIFVDYDISFSISISNINDFQQLTNLTLERELLTTQMLQECLEESYKQENTSIITSFLDNTMIQEQIEETDKANTLNDKIKNIGNNIALLQLFDNAM